MQAIQPAHEQPAGFLHDFNARFTATSYEVQSHTFKQGLIKAVTIHYIGRNRAWGGFTANGAIPSGGSLSVAVGDKTRTWLAQYAAGGMVQETHTPEWKPTPQQVIPEDKRRGSLDPLSAAIPEIAGVYVGLLEDPLVPSFNGILARLLLRYHLGRCKLPAVVFDPEVDGRFASAEALVRRLVELLNRSYDGVLGKRG